jgi:hypothetical protein
MNARHIVGRRVVRVLQEYVPKETTGRAGSWNVIGFVLDNGRTLYLDVAEYEHEYGVECYLGKPQPQESNPMTTSHSERAAKQLQQASTNLLIAAADANTEHRQAVTLNLAGHATHLLASKFGFTGNAFDTQLIGYLRDLANQLEAVVALQNVERAEEAR